MDLHVNRSCVNDDFTDFLHGSRHSVVNPYRSNVNHGAAIINCAHDCGCCKFTGLTFMFNARNAQTSVSIERVPTAQVGEMLQRLHPCYCKPPLGAFGSRLYCAPGTMVHRLDCRDKSPKPSRPPCVCLRTTQAIPLYLTSSTCTTPSASSTVHMADDLSALASFGDCPACKQVFLTRPLVLVCGHSVCSECADAMRACFLCQRPIASCFENCERGECIQEVRGDCASAYPPPSPRRFKMHKVSQTGTGLFPLLDRSAVALATLSEAAHAVAGAKKDLRTNTLACLCLFNHGVDGLLVRVEEYRARWLAQVQLTSLNRVKELEARTDLLDVSAGQLGACVALSRAALADGEDGPVHEAAQTAKAMQGLLVVPTRLCTGTRLLVLCDPPSALACPQGATRLLHFEVDAARSSASGNGLTAYANDGAAHNVIWVTCMDSDGVLAHWATLEDADVGMTVNGAVWPVASASFTDRGVLQVTYVVEEGGAEEMEVDVSLRGMAVPGGPWRACAGFSARGLHVTTLPVKDEKNSPGLAISSDGSLMVVSSDKTHQLSVYRTKDGSRVRSFGGPGTGPGRFGNPYGLCMTAHDTVLVAELSNKRIQEVTLEGAHVKFIPVGVHVRDVGVHGDVVAVCTDTIRLYSYTTGVLIRNIPSSDGMVFNIRFAPDGKHMAVVKWAGHIELLSEDGVFVRHLGPIGFYTGVAFTCTGDVVGVAWSGVVSVFSATDGRLLRSWGTLIGNFSEINYVSALSVSSNRLYLCNLQRVEIFV